MTSTEKIPLKLSEKQKLFHERIDKHIGKLVCIRQQIFWSKRGADTESNKICLLIRRVPWPVQYLTGENLGYAITGDADWKSEIPKADIEVLIDDKIAYLKISQLFIEFLP